MTIARRTPIYHTPEEWTSYIEEFRASGKTRRAWCEEAGLAMSTMLRWENRLVMEGQVDVWQQNRFAEIEVSHHRSCTPGSGVESTPSEQLMKQPQFAIEYRNCRLYMNEGFSEDDLRKIMRVVQDAE